VVTNDNKEDSMSDAHDQDEPVVAVEPDEDFVADEPVVEARHEMPPRPAQPNRGPHKGLTQIANEVWAGQWGGEGWQDRVQAAGFDSSKVEHLVLKGVGRKSSNDVVPPTRPSDTNES
jgi:hypothetical protein